MLEIYWTKNKDVHRKVEILLERKLGKGFEIKRTENGKPYIDGNPLYFSLSHSLDHAIIAICDKPVGVDLEFYDPNGRLKSFKHVLARFSKKEQEWIDGKFDYFFLNWVSKEAYIKMTGGTLAHDLKRLEFVNYRLYCDGEIIDGHTVTADFAAGIYAICAEGYTSGSLSLYPAIRFRLRKGEKI